MRINLIVACILVFASCGQKAAENPDFDSFLKKKEFTVIMFFAPDCPLCITYSKPFALLSRRHKNIQFVAVQSGMHYDAMEIQEFAKEVNFKVPIFRDYDYRIAKRFNATVTPEFFLVDSSGEVWYYGLLDDRMEDLGVYKQNWNRHFLRDALLAVENGHKPQISETVAVGCVLEY